MLRSPICFPHLLIDHTLCSLCLCGVTHSLPCLPILYPSSFSLGLLASVSASVEVLADRRLWWTYFCTASIDGTRLYIISIDRLRLCIISIINNRTHLCIFTINSTPLRIFNVDAIGLYHSNIDSLCLGTTGIDGELSRSNL